jgi:N-acetylneuraminate synthase
LKFETFPIFVAEISANHLGDFNRARKLVNAAIDSGATAVKFQTYTADTMTLDLAADEFRISSNHALWGGRSLYSLYEEAHTPWDWHRELFEICRERGAIPFSSPFDATAVDFLEELNVSMYKIASMETGDLPLIRKVAQTGKPVIISTGATELKEIQEAVTAVLETGNSNLTLLLCTSSYPAEPCEAHLSRLETLKSEFGVKVGVSDHTLGIGVSIAAVALGASVVEKHFTLNRSDGGADSAFSMEPEEFAQLVRECKNAFAAIGSSEWRMQDSESESRRLRRSLYVVQQVKSGDRVNSRNVRAIRPNGGLPPKYYDEIMGKTFKKSCEPGTPMSLDLVD